VIKKEDHLKEDELEHQYLHKSSLASYEAYKKFHTNLLDRYQEQLNYIVKSLDFIDYYLKSPKKSFSKTETIEIVESCLKAAQFLSRGMIAKIEEEPVHLGILLEEVKQLFAERIFKFNLTLEMTCPENLFFYGDFLFTEFILSNLLCKSIYRVPKNGKISIQATEEMGSIKIEIQDNGYSLNKVREKLIKKSFNLLIEESFLQEMCRENGFIYESSKSGQGLTITKIIIPDIQTENLKSNVIQLFK